MEKLTTVYFLPLTIYGGAWNGNNTIKAATSPLLLNSVSLNPFTFSLSRSSYHIRINNLVWQDSDGGNLEKNTTSETWYVYLTVLKF
jgi:hypothetical protein